MEFLVNLDLISLLKAVGLIGLAGIIFAESGLLLGFFLPGDSLLFTAGFLASQGFFDITVLVFLCFAAAVLGDSVGYSFGRKSGPFIFRKEDSIFFHRRHLETARLFYERHGGKTIILARFLPMVRTFAPILAGVGRMSYPWFLFYNIAGAALWAVGLTLLGYYLGSVVPNADRYLLPIILVVIFLSSLPTAVHVWKSRRVFKDKI